jgi:ABC-type nitrate/sulfonate/bicarbonate transport system substrate-binding protein
MAKARLAYRPSGYQLPIISLIQERKLYHQFGLDAEMDLVERTEEAERLLIEGEIGFVIGNHITPMADRVKGVPIIYMAQATNWSVDRMVTLRTDINGIPDLKGKRITFGGLGDSHPSLTKRLYVSRAGLDLTKDIESIPTDSNDQAQMQSILDEKIDVAFVSSPFDIRARKMGLRVIDLPPVPMVCGMTVTTMSPFARENGDLVKRVIQTIASGVYHFKTDRKEAFRIMKARLSQSKRLQLDSDDLIEHLYTDTVDYMEKKLYPTAEAIQNVYQAAMIIYPEVKGLNPLSMWDLHYTRELDEEGFFDKLYGS